MKILIDGKDAFECSRPEISEAFKVLKNAANFADQKMTINFRPGLRVSFIGRHGSTIIGEIMKVNSKSVTVKPETPGPMWNVSPTLITVL